MKNVSLTLLALVFTLASSPAFAAKSPCRAEAIQKALDNCALEYEDALCDIKKITLESHWPATKEVNYYAVVEFANAGFTGTLDYRLHGEYEDGCQF